MNTPLAESQRPRTLDEFVGQKHLVGKGAPIRKMIEQKTLSSLILWGPPGTGKTTLARIIAHSFGAEFVSFSAVISGIAEIKKLMVEARSQQSLYGINRIVFIDEIHRFNKAQQDAFLPYVEQGTIVLIGATTENPGFEVNAPLISRSRVFILDPLTEKDIMTILIRAVKAFPGHSFRKKALSHIVRFANGDARRALGALELSATLSNEVTVEIAHTALQRKSLVYDKSADGHYDTISAFIKSMRGADPDAALHYLARMIEGGEDPLFIARRMVIFASEDIGNAQPTALVLATSCMQAVHMIGMPESQLILSQTATYLATAKKSTASTDGIFSALEDVRSCPLDPIPLHLRNASNTVMKNAGYAKGHIRYPWKEEKRTGKTPKQQYLPDNLKGKKYYKI